MLSFWLEPLASQNMPSLEKAWKFISFSRIWFFFFHRKLQLVWYYGIFPEWSIPVLSKYGYSKILQVLSVWFSVSQRKPMSDCCRESGCFNFSGMQNEAKLLHPHQNMSPNPPKQQSVILHRSMCSVHLLLPRAVQQQMVWWAGTEYRDSQFL